MGKRYIFASKKRHFRKLLTALIAVSCVLCLVVLFNMINNGRVQVDAQTVTLPSQVAALENFRILHMSDLNAAQFGQDMTHFQTAIAGLPYKMVCATGDMVGKSGNAAPFIELIQTLSPNAQTYFIAGDADPAPILYAAHGSAEVKADWVLAAEAAGAVYVDRPLSQTVGKTTVWLWPESLFNMDLSSTRTSLTNLLASISQSADAYSPDNQAKMRAYEYRLQIIEDTQAALNLMTSDDVHILLTHAPLQAETFQMYQQWALRQTGLKRQIALVLAGHYNGGQCRLPFYGAAYVPASGLGSNGWFPDREQVCGVTVRYGIAQHITKGLGVSSAYALPFRLFNTPAVTMVTLTNRLTK